MMERFKGQYRTVWVILASAIIMNASRKRRDELTKEKSRFCASGVVIQELTCPTKGSKLQGPPEGRLALTAVRHISPSCS